MNQNTIDGMRQMAWIVSEKGGGWEYINAKGEVGMFDISRELPSPL